MSRDTLAATLESGYHTCTSGVHVPTEPSVSRDRVFRFGPFELSEREGELRKGGVRIKLQEQPFRVLVELVASAGRLVSREDLQQKLWPSDTFVDFDVGLNSTIRKLRQALNDDADHPHYIETLAKRGYKFVAPVADSTAAPHTTSKDSPPGTSVSSPSHDTTSATRGEIQRSWRSRPRPWHMVAAGLTLLTLGVGLARWLRPSSLPEVKARRVMSNSADAPVTGAVVSPDGKYVSYSDPTGVYIRQVGGGETRPLTLPARFNAIPTSWFPDSTHLLITNHEGPQGTARIWKLSILGGEPQMLLEDAEEGIISPDGTRIAFFRGGNYERALWLMDSSSENPHLFFKPEPDPSGVTQTDTWAASWSPDGERIAYIQRKSVPSTYPSGDRFFVFTRKVDGSDPKLVVQDSRMDYFTSSELRPVLCWAPNGRLYFALRSQAQGGHFRAFCVVHSRESKVGATGGRNA